MNITINASSVSGKAKAPASKSISQRALAAALLHNGTTILTGIGNSCDELTAIHIIQQLGATVYKENNKTIIISSGTVTTASNITINCGESGLAARMFLPIAALNENEKTITGNGSLMHRPFDVYEKILPTLGVHFNSNSGKLPIVISGKLQAQNISLDGSLSSQFLTGLLFAYSASERNKKVCITVNQLHSKPYIDMTLQTIASFGLNVPENNNYTEFVFYPGQKTGAKELQYNISGDWSGAAFLLVAAAICGNITVENLDINTTQADAKILDVLAQVGATITINECTVTVKSANLNCFIFDATDCPDLIPSLVVLAANCNGESKIIGTNRLIHKESNRVESLKHLMTVLDIPYDCSENCFFISGKKMYNGGVIDSYNDHRIAMAAAIAALKAKDNVKIKNALSVNKSFPEFWQILKEISEQKHY